MNKIDKQMQKIKREKRLGLMTHVVVGYPTMRDSISIIKIMEKSGADFIELQIPFSDPLADGSSIMKACEKSLEQGIKVKDVLNAVKLLSKDMSVPLLFMAYFNTVFKYGVEKFCRDAAEVGVSGLIVPDMPIEEEQCEHFDKYCRKYNLKNIRVISPASTDERLRKNAKVASGFVYFTARQGITGVREVLDPNIVFNLKKVRKHFTVLIAVGFGISKKEHLDKIKPYADIAVVGSAFIDIINKSDKNNLKRNIASFIKSIKT